MAASPPVLLTLSLAGGISALAWRAGALTAGGAVAATVVGTAVLSGAGWAGGVVLLAFFIPSTAVGRLALGRPSASDARGERRDPVQVLANGGPAMLAALAEWRVPGLGFWMMTASLAAAAADTWATSTGALAAHEPRHLLTGQRVPRGTSGGVSALGTLGALAGAAVVGAAGGTVRGGMALALAATAIGLAGMLLDSLLGASVQARYECPACRIRSERRRHRCGARTHRTGGWPWLDNDGVNALATAAAAGSGGLAWVWLGAS